MDNTVSRNKALLSQEVLGIILVFFLVSVFLLTSIFSCKSDNFNYGIVFPKTKVNRIDLIITAENWQAMFEDMARHYGEFGAGKGRSRVDFWNEYLPFFEWPSVDPIFVPCEVVFEGKTWKHVGVRFKGSVSLALSWWWGNYKLPFKLDFDQFENEYPETREQSFFGVRKLSFKNHNSEGSYLRYKIATDLFREEGVAAPQVAFYRVYLNLGDGPTYLGLYTAAESPQKTMYLSNFGSKGGDLYRPAYSSPDAWAGLKDADESTFPKKNNYDKKDWSAIQKAISALNDDMDDEGLWRDNLEMRFDVVGFVKWLAINSVLENWDVTGNNYLYSDPLKGGLVRWIAWDVDQSFPNRDISPQIDYFFNAPLTLNLSSVDESRPLIRYILDDEIYGNYYISSIKAFARGIFSIDSMNERLRKEHDLIHPYVIGPDGELPDYGYTDRIKFEMGLQELFQFVEKRHLDIEDFLVFWASKLTVVDCK